VNASANPEPDPQPLPILGEAPPELWEAASGGQPVVLTRDGQPALVVLDLDVYREWEEAAGTAP
jgi:prevent-host-death family protein